MPTITDILSRNLKTISPAYRGLSEGFETLKPVVSGIIDRVKTEGAKKPGQGLFDITGALNEGYSKEEIQSYMQKEDLRPNVPFPDEAPEPLLDREGRTIIPQQANIPSGAPFFPPGTDQGTAAGAEAKHLPLTPSGHESILEDWVKELPRRAANLGIQGSASFVEGLTGIPDLLLPGTPITDVTKKYFTEPARDIAYREFGETPESYSTKGGNILGTGAAMLPSIGLASKVAAPFASGVSRIPYAGTPLSFLTKSAATTTGALAPLKGDFPSKEEFGIGLLVDVVFSGLGKAFGPLRMQHKAMGLSPEVSKKLSKVVSSVTDDAGKPLYENIDDFAIKNNLKGSREQMLEQAKTLFEEAKGSKARVLGKIKTLTKNDFDELIAYLQGKYTVPGMQKELSEINKLVRKKSLTAVELDKLRYLADQSLPSAAYRGAEPVPIKGIERLINPLRQRLAVLDTTGTIRKLNLHKRILNTVTEQATKSLSAALEASKSKQLLIPGGIRSGLAGGAGYGLSSLFPSLFGTGGMATAIPAVYEALTSIPQISSELARIGAKLGKTGLPQVIPPLTKGALRALVPRVESEEEKKVRLEQEDRLRRIQEQQQRMLR